MLLVSRLELLASIITMLLLWLLDDEPGCAGSLLPLLALEVSLLAILLEDSLLLLGVSRWLEDDSLITLLLTALLLMLAGGRLALPPPPPPQAVSVADVSKNNSVLRSVMVLPRELLLCVTKVAHSAQSADKTGVIVCFGNFSGWAECVI